MSKRSHTFFYYLLVLMTLLIQPVRSQGILGMASGGMVNNPIVSGELGGMQVAVQGAYIAFMAAKAWHGATFDLDACARDLHCTMQKNNTDAVVVSPEGVWMVDKPRSSIDTGSIVPTEPLLPSVFQSGRAQLKPGNTPSITFIATEEIQPTATLATMNTGIEVIEKTPAIVWLNSSTMQWLAELVEWFGIWRSNNTLDEDESLFSEFETAPANESQRQTRIIDEYHDRSSRLTSSSPVPSPQVTSIENRRWEDEAVQIKTDTDILTIWPSASSQYQTSGSYSVSMRQVPSGTGSSNTETQTVSASPTPTDEPLPAQLPQGLLKKRSASTANNVLEDETGQALVTTKHRKLIRPKWLPKLPKDDRDKVYAEYLSNYPDEIPREAKPKIQKLVHTIKELDFQKSDNHDKEFNLKNEQDKLWEKWYKLKKNKGQNRRFNVEKRIRGINNEIDVLKKKWDDASDQSCDAKLELKAELNKYITKHCTERGCNSKLEWKRNGYEEIELFLHSPNPSNSIF